VYDLDARPAVPAPALEVELLWVQEIGSSSRTVGPAAKYRWGERVRLSAGFESYEGDALGLFGFLRANQLGFMQIAWAL
jgi:hypothetical protein